MERLASKRHSDDYFASQLNQLIVVNESTFSWCPDNQVTKTIGIAQRVTRLVTRAITIQVKIFSFDKI